MDGLQVYESPRLGRVSEWLHARDPLFGDLMPTLARFRIGDDGKPLPKVVAKVWQTPDGNNRFNILKGDQGSMGTATSVAPHEGEEPVAHLLRTIEQCDRALEEIFELPTAIDAIRKAIEQSLLAEGE